MKIQVHETEKHNVVSFEKIEDGGAFIAPSGSLCIKRADLHNAYILFDDTNVRNTVSGWRAYGGCDIEPETMVEPVEIESIDIKIVRGSPSGTNR